MLSDFQQLRHVDKPKKSETPDQPLAPFWRQGWTELDKVFDNFRRDFERSLWFPAMTIPPLSMSSLSCDIADEGDRYVVTTEMPGVSKGDIKLNVSDNAIEISAEHKEEAEEKKKNYLRKERKAVSYHRSLPLPEKVNASNAKAKLNNGILTVEIAKITPTPKSKSTQIQVQ